MTKAEANVINNSMRAAQITRLGDKVKQALSGSVGNIIYLDPTHGADSNLGDSPDSAVKTLATGYARLRDGYNDVLVYLASTGSITLSTGFVWAKSYAHFVGACAPVAAAKRARLFQAPASTGVTLFTVSGSGCVFKDLYIFQGVADATSLVNVLVTGQRNYFENVHFAGIGNILQSAPGAASLKIDGGAENVFYNCQIGLDTVARDADATELLFDSAATRNVFKDCQLYGYISAAGYSQVTVNDATAIDRYQIFENCLFMTDSENKTIAQTSVFNIKEAIVQGKIILKNSCAITDGVAEWDSNNRGIIYNNTAAAAASAAGGIMTNQ